MANLNTYVGAYMKFPTDIKPFLVELYQKEKDNENSPIAGLIADMTERFGLDDPKLFEMCRSLKDGFFIVLENETAYLPNINFYYPLKYSKNFSYNDGEKFLSITPELINNSIDEVKQVYGYLIEYIDKRIVETVRQKWRERVNAAPDDIPLTYIPTTVVEFGCFNYYDNL